MSQELSLFDQEVLSPEVESTAPLATRLRPDSFENYLGQEELVRSGALKRIVEAGKLDSSFILWGPPGSGKTTLAHLIAQKANQRVHRLSAVTDGLKELREVVKQAERSSGDILFIDEIHRYNKAQQDALLPLVESGRLRLLGATTENPYFELRKALLSRCRVLRLEKLSDQALKDILERALKAELGLGKLKLEVDEEVLVHISQAADGDARSALNLLELASTRAQYQENGSLHLRETDLTGLLSDQHLAYNRSSDRRYDVTSAFIKSIRASEPDAALYWLACMLAAGEDPKYIFRRLLIAASEDVGLADPSAIVLVNSCAQAFQWVGLPEGKYHLSQATLYLANAHKSDSCKGLFAAEAHLRRHGPGEVPSPLRDGTYKGAKEHGIGVGYQNPHQGKGSQSCLPASVNKVSFYTPGNQGYERTVTKRQKEQNRSH